MKNIWPGKIVRKTLKINETFFNLYIHTTLILSIDFEVDHEIWIS